MRTPKQYQQMEFRQLLFELVSLLKPETYVELGVKKCWTFNKIAPLVKNAYAVDIDVSSHESCIGKCHNDHNVRFFHMTSAQFADHCQDKIDFLFIDADHHRESVLADVSMMMKHLMPYKSIVCLHDTYPIRKELLANGYCSNAWEAANYIRINMISDFEIVTLPGPWAGLSIMRYAPYGLHGWMDNVD